MWADAQCLKVSYKVILCAIEMLFLFFYHAPFLSLFVQATLLLRVIWRKVKVVFTLQWIEEPHFRI